MKFIDENRKTIDLIFGGVFLVMSIQFLLGISQPNNIVAGLLALSVGKQCIKDGLGK